MIKSIRVLSVLTILLVITPVYVQDYPIITVSNLFSPETLEKLISFDKEHAQSEYSIKVVPSASLYCTYRATFLKKYSDFSSCFSLKAAGKTVAGAALSLGWVSYLLCAYLIYKVFKLVRNVNSWINWCIGDDVDANESLDFQKKFQKRLQKVRSPGMHKNSLNELFQEERLMRCYLMVDRFLRARNMRHHFPFSGKKYAKKINKAYLNIVYAKHLARAHQLCTS